MPQKFTNAARSTLMAGISAAATSITLDAPKADLFPVANTGTDSIPSAGKDWFKVVIEDNTGAIEIVYVRTRAAGASSLTDCLRGQEGTTARAYLAGSIVELRHTAADLSDAISFATSASTFWKGLVELANAALSRTALGISVVGDALFTAASFDAVRSSLGLGSGQLAGHRNKLINGAFSINQRVVSGTVTLVANQYGHDYWKAGAGGCVYTFVTANNLTTVTIVSGSLVQIINGKNLSSGTHVLSWGGTAKGRINGGAPGDSGMTAAITGGANTTVEFTAGTLWLAQFEPGSTPTTFEFRLNELQLCQQRYFKTYDQAVTVGTANATGYISRFLDGAGSFSTLSISLPVAMEGIPAVTIYSGSTGAVGAFSRDGGTVSAFLQQAGPSYISARVANSLTTQDQHLTAHFVAVAGL